MYYEVSDKGRRLKPGSGDKRRQAPLYHIAIPVHDDKQTRGYRRLCSRHPEIAPAAFGVFHKLLEISANMTHELRGYIVHQKHGKWRFFTEEELAERMSFPQAQVAAAIEALVDCGWLRKVPTDKFTRIVGERSASEREAQAARPGFRIQTRNEGVVVVEPEFVELLRKRFPELDVDAALNTIAGRLAKGPEHNRPLAKNVRKFLEAALASEGEAA